jgi:hypothetical protein
LNLSVAEMYSIVAQTASFVMVSTVVVFAYAIYIVGLGLIPQESNIVPFCETGQIAQWLNQAIAGRSADGRFECQCGKTYQRAQELKRHQKKCEYLEETFCFYDSILVHSEIGQIRQGDTVRDGWRASKTRARLVSLVSASTSQGSGLTASSETR